MEACGRCDSCRMIPEEPDRVAEHTHPDFHIIRKELAGTSQNAVLRSRKQLNIPVDLLREFLVGGQTSGGQYHDAVAYRTAALRHGKAFIIDEAELMDSHGQNALLKTLEEPPAGSLFVLISSSEDRLLITIRSRCRRLGFGPLSEPEMVRWIEHCYPELEQGRRKMLTFFAQGSPGRFLLGEQFELDGWVEQVGRGLRQLEQGNPDGELGGLLADLINEFAERWVKDNPQGSKDAANRRGAELMWSIVGTWIRVSMAKAAAQAGHSGADSDVQREMLQPWLTGLEALTLAESELAANVNMRLVTDHLVAGLWRAMAVSAEA